ncbi:L-threonylcarbamoyladenylate synthase [Gracilibacillus sp. S3-1-1]|uniref:L-threonylcarbamoyladenylate synthase n=1 Tax=Gracilibacillus pellucidus TaxID=3095368 RepID=A0ACC6M9R6_9BACI|nr:L-threonylcarbamoyladenylate synthase [Gracilibacillus sp. S3-1-1]MDX8047728.1 L-threonylcarbamoyladenylate synthase [Gracilibacillus sp. S3-1-1]
MKTEKFDASTQSLQTAGELLRNQELVAFPTETVYGLGADATSESAVSKIYQAKGRPSDNPLIVHVHDAEQIMHYVREIPPLAQQLIEHFMPGPFTIILKSNGTVAKSVTAGLDTVAIRIPGNPIARKLIKEATLPLAAPSANLSGKPSPTTAEHVYQDLAGRIAGIIDGGPTGVGLESTVVDGTGEIPVILRPGGVTKQAIEQVVGKVEMSRSLEDNKPKAPGMKYNHYEPDAPLILVDGDREFFQQYIHQYQQKGQKVGVIASNPFINQLQGDIHYDVGSHEVLEEVAANLYYALRFFNDTDVDIILAEAYPLDGIGEAIMNRLTKAATDYYQQK